MKNQFGESVDTTSAAANLTYTVYNVTTATTITSTNLTHVNGKIQINASQASIGDKIRVTLTSGTLTTSKQIEVVNGIVASKVTVGSTSIVNAPGASEDRLFYGSKFSFPLSITDQYGDAIALSDFSSYTGATAGSVDINGAVISRSNDLVDVNSITVKDGVVTVTINSTSTTSPATDAGTNVSLIITVASTGEVIPVTVPVYTERRASKLVGFAAGGTFASNTTMTEGTDAKVKATDFVFEDQYGKTYTSAFTSSTKVSVMDAVHTNKAAAAATTTTEQGLVIVDQNATVVTANLGSEIYHETGSVTDPINAELQSGSEDTYVHASFGSSTATPTEKITFKYVDPVVSTNVSQLEATIKVINAVDSVGMAANAKTYNVGDTAIVTLKAYVAGGTSDSYINKDYNKSLYMTFNVGNGTTVSKKYTRFITFVNGIASTTLPILDSATTQISTLDTVEGETFANITGLTAKVGAFQNYDVNFDGTNVTLTAQDAYGNTVTTKKATSLITKVTAQKKVGTTKDGVTTYQYTDVKLTGSGIDDEGTVLATEAAGVVTIANVVSASDFVSGSTYVLTITMDGKAYTVDYVAHKGTITAANATAYAEGSEEVLEKNTISFSGTFADGNTVTICAVPLTLKTDPSSSQIAVGNGSGSVVAQNIKTFLDANPTTIGNYTFEVDGAVLTVTGKTGIATAVSVSKESDNGNVVLGTATSHVAATSATARVDDFTVAVNLASDETIAVDGIVLDITAGANTTETAAAIKDAIEANATLNARYTVALPGSANVVKLTQKSGHESATAPTMTVVSK